MGHVVDQGQVSRVDQPTVAGQTRHEEGDTRHGERADGEFSRHHVERGCRHHQRSTSLSNITESNSVALPDERRWSDKKPAMNASTMAKDCR